MDRPYKIYLAAGWFSPEQADIVEQLEKALVTLKFHVYSPRLHSMFNPAKNTGKEIVAENVKAIKECDFIVASTEGKDMGTLWECGYASALGIPVVYYYPHKNKFNLMLADSAHAVCDDMATLVLYLCDIKSSGLDKAISPIYMGEKE